MCCTPAGGLPDSWGNGLANLQQLRISGAPNITGPIPASWSNLTHVQQLELSGLGLTGPLPSQWAAGMSNLSDLSLQRMPQLLLPNSSVTAWVKNPNATRLELRQVGGMSGLTLDPSLASIYPSLMYLSLSGLGLTGSVPSAWQLLGSSSNGKIKVFDLSGNALGGGLPDWLTYVVAPDGVLDMSFNAFTGECTVAKAMCQSYQASCQHCSAAGSEVHMCWVAV